MANDKDFVVAGAVEVGKDTKVTLGSITSSDIDLATGNYFSDTLAANTTYTISNAGDVQAFQLEVTGGAAGYDIGSASYDSKSFSVSTQESAPNGLFFKPDGTKMYIVGTTGDDINQYSLSTAWDVSTASFDSVTFSVSSQTTLPTDVFFKSDGLTMYVASNSTPDTVFQYTLSTAWDVSTASYASKSINVSSQEGTVLGIHFKTDGTKLYVIGIDGDDVNQYSLSTAWDLSTASFDSVTFSVSSETTAPASVWFSTDGLKMFVLSNGGTYADSVIQYNLTTAWDLSTASFSTSFSISSQELAPEGLAFSADGTKMYMVGAVNQTVYQYSTATDTTVTWPSSIEWAGGIAPSAPAVGETDVFTLSTDDGGTSYVGVKSADNLS